MAAIRTAVPTMRGVATGVPRCMPRMASRMSPVRSFQTSRIGAAIKTLYTVEHEWVRYDDESNIGTIGITNHAQDSLGDVVYIELPPVELEAARGDQIGSIESVKAASDIYSPVSGIIVESNVALDDQPNLVNKSPMDQGWLAKIKLSDASELDQLLSEEAYNATLE
ncbi:glycine cleavage system H-protein subunit [Malassezia yamatoensis]|uniref:Glycine cleavage system H protein n=1 Tax=Malassezia yamatoensis TaxID=253288 RepID=A0AAJ6CKQ9_9BASI|nr:glycine cleavage system H-protein subunit [Malassezia yamatoensis]